MSSGEASKRRVQGEEVTHDYVWIVLVSRRFVCRKFREFALCKSGQLRNLLDYSSSPSRTRLKRNALVMTLTEDIAMAAAPMTGDSNIPKVG
jgi:hypothetical protein